MTLGKSLPLVHTVGADQVASDWGPFLSLLVSQFQLQLSSLDASFLARLPCLAYVISFTPAKPSPSSLYSLQDQLRSTFLQEALPHHPPTSACPESELLASQPEEGTQDPLPSTWDGTPLCLVVSSAQQAMRLGK